VIVAAKAVQIDQFQLSCLNLIDIADKFDIYVKTSLVVRCLRNWALIDRWIPLTNDRMSDLILQDALWLEDAEEEVVDDAAVSYHWYCA